jgi:membrane-associated protease RseP (regulator of RpoE activity)
MSDDPTGSDPVEPTRPEPIPSEQLEPPTAEVTDAPTTESTAAAAPTAETPTYAPPTVEARPASVPPAAGAPTEQVPVAAAAPARRRGVMVPWWALAVVAALVVFGGGYLIGHAVGDDHGDGRASARFVVPGGRAGGNEFPFGGGNGNGNGNPFGGNGNGTNPFGGDNGNGGGNGNGGSRPSTQSTAFLGVGVADAANGVRVTTVVAGGPASDSGIAQGAVITAIDGTKVTDVASLRSEIAQHQPGDTVKVTYTSNGATKTATVTLGDRNASSQ